MSEKGYFSVKPHRKVMDREAIVDLMKQGRVVAVDRRSGEYVTSAFGVQLPAPETCIAGCTCTRKN